MAVPGSHAPGLSCIVPVTWTDADAWLRGKLSDANLLLSAPFEPEAVFVAGLGSDRDMIHRVTYWFRRGAVCAIWRTGNPIIAGHWSRHGAVATLLEEAEGHRARRFILPPPAFAKFFSRFGKANAL